MVPVDGIPMIERLLEVLPTSWLAHFVLAEDHRNSELPGLLARLRPESSIQHIEYRGLGPGYAIRAALSELPDDSPVFVSYCDYGMTWDPRMFERFVRDTGCDACVVSYRGFHAHYLNPVTYAYSRLGGDRVVEVKEKGSFTGDREMEYASAGGYYFRSASILEEALDAQETLDLQVNGEFYTSLTVEALIRSRPDADVRVFEIPGFFQWGTPRDLLDYEYWKRSFQAGNRIGGRRGRVAQVLMPMAGLGARFKELTTSPKPFISVGERPMFRAALDSLPVADRVVFVALNDHRQYLADDLLLSSIRAVFIDATPGGQALSTHEGLREIDPGKEVMVSSCDHAIVIEPDRWESFHARPDCDAAILTIRGLPASIRTPDSFTYVVGSRENGPFPLVDRVSVKALVSDDPRRDDVLVGTFWFSTAQVLADGIAELKRRDLHVHGEIYLDSVFECMMDLGATIRMVPLDGYVNWGDPDSLAEALYWQEMFCGRRIDYRPRFPEIEAHP